MSELSSSVMLSPVGRPRQRFEIKRSQESLGLWMQSEAAFRMVGLIYILSHTKLL